MLLSRRTTRTVAIAAAAIASASLAAPNVAAARDHERGKDALAVTQTNLASNLNDVGATLVDPDVVNPWGLALGPTTPLWSANNGTDTATLYAVPPDLSAVPKVPTVRVTFPHLPELPTGQVFNGTNSFQLPIGAPTTPARFIFSTLTGHIEAWSPVADPLLGNAETAATTPGAVYTGLAIGTASTGDQLYAADFGGGKVDVFDAAFQPVTLASWQFHDRFLPSSFHPFGIQALDGHIFVAYALPGPGGPALSGRGLGAVDEFTADGAFVARVASGHTLNAPWGMAIAPAGWGRIAGDLLVGNFGDGRINVIRANDDKHRAGMFGDELEGQLRDATTGRRFDVGRGLWALLPGTATTGGTNTVFFSAGIDNEMDGLIGALTR